MYLYVLRCQELYKIGIAGDVVGRVAQLQTGNPYPIEICAYYEFDNAAPVEQTIHQRFSAKRQSGEWFRLERGDLSTIDQICALLDGVAGTLPIAVDEQDVDEADADADYNGTGAKPREFSIYDAEGYRLQLEGAGKYKGRYYQWVIGTGANRKIKRGGLVSDLPKEIQDRIRSRYSEGGICAEHIPQNEGAK